LIVTGAATVVIATLAVVLPAGKKAMAAANASTGPSAQTPD
jgi:hypothetical protein